jgi:hypothetical protein
MRHLRVLVDFYADEKYRYARFERHIGKKRTISKLAKEILNMQAPNGNERTKVSVKEHHLNKWRDWKQSRDAPEERIIMDFGAAKVGSMKHIRGSMKGPHKALLDELKKMKNVLVIMEDEWYASQVCSSCGIRGLEIVGGKRALT